MKIKNPLPNPINYHILHRCDQAMDISPFYNYILANRGLYKYAYNHHYIASILVAPAVIPGLAAWDFEGIALTIPKIPVHRLLTVLDHARRAHTEPPAVSPIEQMYHFYHFDDSRGWQVSLPPQEAGVARLTYRGGHQPSIVLDLHSHHQMDACFSLTDNRDEQGSRLYVVIGRIHAQPVIKCRVGIYGDYLNIPALDIFQELGPFTDQLELEAAQ